MAARTSSADEIAAGVVAAGVAPDCAAACAVRVPAASGGSSWMVEEGGATDLLFDLASVTKPMTALAVARSGLDRHTLLGALVPEARGTPSEAVSLELLLAHRAGLDGHRDLHAPLLHRRRVDMEEALRVAARARRADVTGDPPPDGFPPVYSDLGYVLAGVALARFTAVRDAGEAIDRWVCAPLGIGQECGTVRELRDRGVHLPFAPTEIAPWRGGLVRGAVHDENAWALTGLGGSGHAGIFATAGAVVRFGAAVLDALDGVPSPLGVRGIAAPGESPLHWLVRPRPGGSLRAGFDGKSSEGSSAGSRFGAASFGHLGFTGTSLWIDPDAKIVAVLLTNRVCPTRQHVAIREARPQAHDALWARARSLAVVVP